MITWSGNGGLTVSYWRVGGGNRDVSVLHAVKGMTELFTVNLKGFCPPLPSAPQILTKCVKRVNTRDTHTDPFPLTRV